MEETWRETAAAVQSGGYKVIRLVIRLRSCGCVTRDGRFVFGFEGTRIANSFTNCE